MQESKKPVKMPSRLDKLEQRIDQLEARLNATDTDLDSVMQVCNL